jgi:hypothetical protein
VTADPRDEGGDAACWLHLFEDEQGEDAGGPGPPSAEAAKTSIEPELEAEPPDRADPAAPDA